MRPDSAPLLVLPVLSDAWSLTFFLGLSHGSSQVLPLAIGAVRIGQPSHLGPVTAPRIRPLISGYERHHPRVHASERPRGLPGAQPGGNDEEHLELRGPHCDTDRKASKASLRRRGWRGAARKDESTKITPLPCRQRRGRSA